MKGKGKTKSEKVRTALLFTFSLLLFTSAARAEELQPVPYLDWDAETRQMGCRGSDPRDTVGVIRFAGFMV